MHKNLYSEKTGQFFFQKLKQDGSMIELYIKAKICVCRRLNFRATVHKMPDLLFLSLDCNVDVAHGDVNVTKLFAPHISYRFLKATSVIV